MPSDPQMGDLKAFFGEVSTNKKIILSMSNENDNRRTSGLAVTSMVMGILSFFIFFTAIPQILAVVFGHIALSQCNRDSNLNGKGMAIAGLVMGWLVLAFSIFYLLLFMGLGVASAVASSS